MIVPRSMKKVWIIFLQKLGGLWITTERGKEVLRLMVYIILFFQEIYDHCVSIVVDSMNQFMN